MNDLLPRTQHEPAILDGHRERRPKQRGLQVRMAIAIVPGAFVTVIATRWNQLVQHVRRRPSQIPAGLQGPSLSGWNSKSGCFVRAIDDIGFQVQAGEINGLLGPKGAGKTTTMR
jgi:ABC-type glutathione transport system ATPase component